MNSVSLPLKNQVRAGQTLSPQTFHTLVEAVHTLSDDTRGRTDSLGARGAQGAEHKWMHLMLWGESQCLYQET